jgi:histidine triad (HIT) family protein
MRPPGDPSSGRGGAALLTGVDYHRRMDCLFCKIVRGEIPASMVYQDDDVVAFNDINPQAPMHVLVVPRKHIDTTNDITEADEPLIGKMLRRGAALARDRGFAERGYRTVFNCHREAGQTVFHIHLHVLGGRPLGWPPG